MFGYVPKFLFAISKAELLGLVVAQIEHLIKAKEPLPADMVAKVLVLTSVAYNCWYLAAVFCALGSR